jgi:hypothetical protein
MVSFGILGMDLVWGNLFMRCPRMPHYILQKFMGPTLAHNEVNSTKSMELVDFI